MGVVLKRGRTSVRFATTDADMDRVMALRSACFRAGGPDRDGFDRHCRHVLLEQAGTAVGTYRLMTLEGGHQIGRSYAAQHYDLSALSHLTGPLVEMGRFCLTPGVIDPDIARLAFGAMTGFVQRQGAEMLFGCASFTGTDPAVYRHAFGMLAEAHQAPTDLSPKIGGRDTVPLATPIGYDPQAARRDTPSLLRSYLAMGGWVSDHAVVDHDLGTLHVFVGLQTGRVPAARRRALARLAG